MKDFGTVLALSGGVGGAKLALGLSDVLQTGHLTIVANTGDDFEFMGMHISPDVDSILYALARVNNPDTGWGRDAETWTFISELCNLGIDAWFRLGDRDLAVHVYRTCCLDSGLSLSAVTSDLSRRFGVAATIVPMSEDPIRTIVDTNAGSLTFQDYFVRHRCSPAVSGIRFEGSAQARMSQAFEETISDPRLAGIILCPSNPYLSIDPILSIPGVVEAIAESKVPVVAISPIVDGQSIKGPTAKIMYELGIPVSAMSIARHYQPLINGFIFDTLDSSMADDISALGITTRSTATVMKTADNRTALARTAVDLLLHLRKAR